MRVNLGMVHFDVIQQHERTCARVDQRAREELGWEEFLDYTDEHPECVFFFGEYEQQSGRDQVHALDGRLGRNMENGVFLT